MDPAEIVWGAQSPKPESHLKRGIEMVQISGITSYGIELALKNVNKVFGDNIIFKRFERVGFYHYVTLAVKDSRGDGSRIGFSGKRVNAACWHVYGLFFDELLTLNPSATIRQCGQKVTQENNWTDRNIGSIAHPLMYSDACDCKANGIHDAIELVRKIT